MFKDRIEYIDTLKGILIILVVIGHTGINPEIKKWIYSFHMPLFLIISGFFYKVNSSIISHKRVERLIFPFLIYTFMAIVLPGLPLLILKSKELEWEKIFYLKEKIFFNTPIWFLIVLFFIEVTMNILFKILNNKRQKNNILMLFLILVQVITLKYSPVLPFGFRIGLASLSTFYIGIFWREHIKYFSFNKNISNLILIFLLPIGLFLGHRFGRVDIFKAEFAENLFQYYILVLINLLFWIEVSKKLIKIKILKLLGEKTIYILGLHYYILFFMRIIYKKLGINETIKDKIGLYFLEGIIAIFIVYIIVKIKDWLFKFYKF